MHCRSRRRGCGVPCRAEGPRSSSEAPSCAPRPQRCHPAPRSPVLIDMTPAPPRRAWPAGVLQGPRAVSPICLDLDLESEDQTPTDFIEVFSDDDGMGALSDNAARVRREPKWGRCPLCSYARRMVPPPCDQGAASCWDVPGTSQVSAMLGCKRCLKIWHLCSQQRYL